MLSFVLVTPFVTNCFYLENYIWNVPKTLLIIISIFLCVSSCFMVSLELSCYWFYFRFICERHAWVAGNARSGKNKEWRINHDTFSREKDHNIPKEAGNTTSWEVSVKGISNSVFLQQSGKISGADYSKLKQMFGHDDSQSEVVAFNFR